MIQIGVPRVLSLKMPDKISGSSSSFLEVVPRICPGALLFNSFFRSSRQNSRLDGTQSKINPMALP